MKKVFLLAMHPDLKAFDFSQTNLDFELKTYIGRMIYGGQNKNYHIMAKGGRDHLKNTLQANAHRKNQRLVH